MNRSYGMWMWMWICMVSLCAASFALGRLTRFEEVRAESETEGGGYQFGDCTYALGQAEAEVLGAFRQEFLVNREEPDFDRPEISLYTIHLRGGNHEQIGSLGFENGVLTTVIRTLGIYESAECGTMVSKLIGALAETVERNDAPVEVRWDDGVLGGRKQGNTTLRFDSSNEVVSVVYFDSPGGSETVSMYSSISHDSPE